MTAAKISFNDILNAIGGENTTISAGNIISWTVTKEKFEDHWRNFRSGRKKTLSLKVKKAVTYLNDIAKSL